MLQKIAGCIMTVVASSGIGFSVARGRDEKRKQLIEWKSTLLFLRDNIRYGHVSLPEVFRKIAQKKNNAPVGIFFGRISEKMQEEDFWLPRIWEEELHHLTVYSKLEKEDVEPILDLGNYLGDMDLLAQYDRLILCVRLLEDRLQIVCEENRRKIRLSRLLGIMGGIFIDVLLL